MSVETFSTTAKLYQKYKMPFKKACNRWGHSSWLVLVPIDRTHDFLLIIHFNYVSISYRFRYWRVYAKRLWGHVMLHFCTCVFVHFTFTKGWYNENIKIIAWQIIGPAAAGSAGSVPTPVFLCGFSIKYIRSYSFTWPCAVGYSSQVTAHISDIQWEARSSRGKVDTGTSTQQPPTSQESRASARCMCTCTLVHSRHHCPRNSDTWPRQPHEHNSRRLSSPSADPVHPDIYDDLYCALDQTVCSSTRSERAVAAACECSLHWLLVVVCVAQQQLTVAYWQCLW